MGRRPRRRDAERGLDHRTAGAVRAHLRRPRLDAGDRLPAAGRELDVAPLVLFAAGGLLYTAGAVIYSLQRPDPWPRTFGFHEIFHALVIAAAVTHFVAIAGWVILPAG